MPGILGKKLGMTRLLKDDGRVIPITVVQCDPNEIAQVKTVDKDGYPALVLGFSKLKHPSKTRKFRFVKEFRVAEDQVANFKKGDMVTLESFKDAEVVKVAGTSIGKGFQGVMKLFHFRGGPRSHGSHFMREPGSVGCRAKPGRIHKGKRMARRMGNEQITLSKVKVVQIDTTKNIICLKGALPGPTGAILTINTAL